MLPAIGGPRGAWWSAAWRGHHGGRARGRPGGRQRRAAAAGGSIHALALTTGHKLLAWGSNFNGELGNNSTTVRHTPVRVKLPSGTSIRSVVAGKSYGMALTTGHRILTWATTATASWATEQTTPAWSRYSRISLTASRPRRSAPGPVRSTALAIGTTLPV